jgi:hypothetical protein
MSFAALPRDIYAFTELEMLAVLGRRWVEGCPKKGHTKPYYEMPCRPIHWILREFILEREVEKSTVREMKERVGRK